MLSGVAAFFQTQTSHRFRARLTMSAIPTIHCTLRARAVLDCILERYRLTAFFQKKKNTETLHGSPHELFDSIVPSLNVKVDGIKPTCLKRF